MVECTDSESNPDSGDRASRRPQPAKQLIPTGWSPPGGGDPVDDEARGPTKRRAYRTNRGPLSVQRLKTITKRLDEGFYDRETTRHVIAARLASDLGLA